MGDKVPSLTIMRFSIVSRFTFEQIQWIIPVTEKSLSDQCEGYIYIYILVWSYLEEGRMLYIEKGLEFEDKITGRTSLANQSGLLALMIVEDSWACAAKEGKFDNFDTY